MTGAKFILRVQKAHHSSDTPAALKAQEQCHFFPYFLVVVAQTPERVLEKSSSTSSIAIRGITGVYLLPRRRPRHGE
jgi:hypothetical protein